MNIALPAFIPSGDDIHRDSRLTSLERQIIILNGKITARDTAITKLLEELVTVQHEVAIDWVSRYPEMLAEIDGKVLEAIQGADEQ